MKQCTTCGKEFDTDKSLMGHVSRKHGKLPNGHAGAGDEPSGALTKAITILQNRAAEIRKQLDGMELLELELTSIQNMLDVHARSNQLAGTSMQHFTPDTPIKGLKA